MCGINGFYNTSGKIIHGERELIGAMNTRIRHRGPDDEGTWSDPGGKLHLGHVRLSIIDLSQAGHQPMSSGPATVVFNGEIYNYREIKQRYPTGTFHTDTDTEVILKLYEEKGTECVRQLHGMFSFALWDQRQEQLFLARDPVGKKPLYYCMQEGVFAFSSEIKSLLMLPWIKPVLDEHAFYHFLTFNMLPPPLTMFQNIHKLEPGTHLRVGKDGRIKKETYWETNPSDLSRESPESLARLTFEHLQRAVRYRMVSDVPVGAFLSGGVDSSAIVALMSREVSQPVKTYSIGFENQPGYDELKYARQVASLFGTEHYEKTVTEKEIIDLVPRMAEIFDEPLADATCIPIYFISQKAREEGTKVVLTGDGSDELFAGYRSYAKYLRYYPWFHAYGKMPGLVKSTISKWVASAGGNSPAAEMFHRAAHNQEFFWGEARSFKESVKEKFLSQEYKSRAAGWNSYEVVEAYRKGFNNLTATKSDLDWMCYLGFKMTDSNRFLYRADRLGMAHSIELRAPFMDVDMVNFALSVPGRLKMKNGEPKYILKKSLEQILPNEILYRKKMGFCVPLREWAGGMMTDYVESNLKEFCENTGLFNEAGLRQTLQQIRQGDANTTNDLWTIYFLMAWFKKWQLV